MCFYDHKAITKDEILITFFTAKKKKTTLLLKNIARVLYGQVLDIQVGVVERIVIVYFKTKSYTISL